MDVGILREKLTTEVQYPGGDDVFVTLEYVSPDEIKAMSRKCKTINYIRHQPVEGTDTDKLLLLLCRRAVKGWKGFTDGGQEFPCTPENIEFMVRHDYDFPRFVQDVCTDIHRMKRSQAEASAKNSGLTSGQDETSRG
jgi:hypothetical protein